MPAFLPASNSRGWSNDQSQTPNPITAPPYAPPPPQTPKASNTQLGRTPPNAKLLAAVAAAAVLVAAGAIAVNRVGAEPTASAPAPATVVTVTVSASASAQRTPSRSPTPTPRTTVDPEVAAQAELDRLIAQSASWVPLDGQWAAMLGGKWVGITDPLQTNSKGGHTFGAADILAEHETLKARVAGVDVVLLDSRTFGDNISHDGQPLYVTIGLGDFNDRDDVLAWCAAQFPELSGARLENQCTSSRLYR